MLSVLETVPVSFRLIDNGLQSCSPNEEEDLQGIFERLGYMPDRQSCRFSQSMPPLYFPRASVSSSSVQAVDGMLSLALYPAQVAVFEAPSSNLPRTPL